MKKIYFALIVFISSTTLPAQVNNGDFESFTTCPSDYSQFDLVTSWTTPTSFKSSDYYQVCAMASNVSVPMNGGGVQSARSGDGYAGIYLVYPGDIREYIEGSLAEPLAAGACYHAEFYISAADFYSNTTDAIGIYFSNTLIIDDPSIINLPYSPQVINPAGNFPDTSGWMLVSGDFTAQGGEQYFIIGNFKNDLNSELSLINGSGYPGAYVYIEDVNVSGCTAVDEHLIEASNIFPNPFNDAFTISSESNEPSVLILYDLNGKIIMEMEIAGNTTIQTNEIAAGMYFYSLMDKKGNVKEQGKLIKN